MDQPAPEAPTESLIPLTKLAKNNAAKSEKAVAFLSTGAYCPIHLMHIEIFEKAKKHMESKGYTVVGAWASPTHDDYVSPKVEISNVQKSIPGEDRVKMTAAACSGSDWIDVSGWECGQETFVDFPYVFKAHAALLKETHPNVQLWYICGEDHAIKCCLFRGNPNLPCVGVARPGGRGTKIPENKYWMFITDTTDDFSSTKVRNAMLKGLPIDKYVHPKVKEYIETNKISVSPDKK